MRPLVVIACLLAAGSAHAGTISLLGLRGERFATALEEDLGKQHALVPAEDYRRAALRLGQTAPSAEAVQAVCAELGLDAIVLVSLRGAGRSRELWVVVREGASGTAIARTRYDLGGHTLPLLRAQVASDLLRVLDGLHHARHEDVAVVAPRTSPREDAALVEPTPEPAELSPTTVVARRAPSYASRGFSAGVGPSLMTRAAAFDVGSAPGYRGGTVMGLRAEGAIFPLALSAELADAHPVLASFGLVGSYEHAFDFTASNATAHAAGYAARFTVLFVGRAPLGHAARGGVLTVETGYQQISWGSSSPTDLGVPNVSYQLVDAGVGWEHELGSRRLALSLRLAAEALVGAGAIGGATQYGPASGWGLEGELGLTIRPTRWLWLRPAARYTPLFLRFGAAGARPASSALDELAEGELEVGFAL